MLELIMQAFCRPLYSTVTICRAAGAMEWGGKLICQLSDLYKAGRQGGRLARRLADWTVR